MGTLVYDARALDLQIDDRTLAHLRVVFMTKLRRGESFMLEVPIAEGSAGRRSLWIHPAVPLVFHFHSSRSVALNRAWLDDLLLSASGPDGLKLLPEPTEPDSSK